MSAATDVTIAVDSDLLTEVVESRLALLTALDVLLREAKDAGNISTFAKELARAAISRAAPK